MLALGQVSRQAASAQADGLAVSGQVTCTRAATTRELWLPPVLAGCLGVLVTLGIALMVRIVHIARWRYGMRVISVRPDPGFRPTGAQAALSAPPAPSG